MACKLSIVFYVSALVLLIASEIAGLVGEKPMFRILAPKFICGNKHAGVTNDTQTKSSNGTPQQIVISLQTKGGEKLRYRVAIQFFLIDGFVSQRHTLQLWRSVRQLEQRLDKERNAITASNQIIISNEELVGGVIYTFNIVGVDGTDELSQDQNFTITYKGENVKSSVDQDGSSSRDDVSLLLLCSETGYADIPYLVTAKVIFCEPKNDYKIIWTISDERIGNLDTQSDTLTIPAGVLKPGKRYEIAATVIDSTSEVPIIKATVKIHILERVLKGSIFPVEATTGAAQLTVIRAAFNNPQLSNLSWSCEDDSGDKSCSDDLIISPYVGSISFTKDARYAVTVSVDNLSISSSIKVNTKSTVSVSLQKLPAAYIIPGQRYEFTVDVKGLVPKCICNWTVVKEEDFAYFDPISMGGIGGLVITDIEENFLSEIVDYGNDTIEREINLIIPPSTNTSQWMGLEPNVLYKFRLAIECPEPVDASFSNGDSRGTVPSYWDMVLETNAPPKGVPLSVTPTFNGTALSTNYIFTTDIANDTKTDFPLRYSFWYNVEKHSMNIANLFEIVSTETQLPYSMSEISTYYLICDSREACARVNGPSIKVQPNSNFNMTERTRKLDAIENHFYRDNYNQAVKIAFELLLTLRNQNSSLFDDTYTQIMIFLEKLFEAIKASIEERAHHLNAVLQLAQQARILIDFQPDASDRLLGQLLELIDSAERTSKRITRSVNYKPIPDTVDIDSTKIGIYKSLITSSNGTAETKSKARTLLLNYIPIIAQRYCANHQTNYSDEWFKLEITRMKPAIRNPLRKSIRIPSGDTKLPQVVTVAGLGGPSDGQLLETASYLCLGSLVYYRDFLSSENVSEGEIYTVFLTVSDKNDIGVIAEWTAGIYVWNITEKNKTSSRDYQCLLWNEEATSWTDNSCRTETRFSSVVCNCTQMGYLRVIITNRPATLEVTTSMEEIYSMSTTILEENITDTTSVHYWDTTTDSEVITLVEISALASTTDSLENSVITTTSAYSPTSESSANLVVNQTKNHNSSILEIEGQSGVNSTHSHQTAATGTLGYSIIAALVLIALLTAIALVLYKRRRHTTSLTEEMQVVAGRMRSSTQPVRYARFQDEHNMSGDNVSTISDSVTV
ncbi:uncharacterized protein LOC129762772 [Toxorhynchites rutilus septentrionalis]|uniref:uncharacterized protein LOC129762772 n=1 Tax=Toxorhynchites rutilus septentrionalis TaxID=329112 RepID=UPI00247913DD|nr:uncharacterized protein LOC129762772 [Toxorhynchites rutilus septentrionalis]